VGVDVDGEPKEAIMRATYRALCQHGYADLTMQDIADEAPVSKSSLHYHYDSKRGLFEAFQRYISERFFDRVREADDPEAPPRERLAAILDAALSPPETDDLRDLQRTLLELQAQAPYEPRIRAHIDEFDARFRGLLAEVLGAGVESGDFRADTDPEETARFIATVLAGNQARQVSVGQDPETTRDLLSSHVEDHLVREGGGE
jgi:AcrR family transcriptional regulator